MSNWLGFSLTPHLRIDEGFGRDEQQNQQQEGGGFVMPLISDGSLCDMDPFRRPSGCEDWRYETEIGAAAAADPSGEAPKLDDFLGCCYSNSSDDNRVNINAPPSFNSTGEIERDPPQQIHPYHHHHHHHQYSETPQTLITATNQIQQNGIYHVPFDHTATSVSGFKSWLRQTAFSGEKSSFSPAASSPDQPNNNCNSQSLSLTMSPGSQHRAVAVVSSPLQVAENRKRPIGGKALVREPVPRKSINTFG